MSNYWGSEAAGAILYDPSTKKFGFGRRSDLVNEPGSLGTFGGAIEFGDTVEETLSNELMEELGYVYPVNAKRLPMFEDESHDFRYHNFLVSIDIGHFEPELNWENDGVEWYSYAELSELNDESRVHFGLAWLLEQKETHSILKTTMRNHSLENQSLGIN